MLANNFLAWVITFGLALSWLRMMDFTAARGWISSSTSRKIIHIGTGPLFVVCWLLFDDQYYARYLAATVPFLTTVQFALIGLGIIKDESSVKAMSRSGKREEILKGPLIYGIVFVLVTIVYWKSSPIGIIALMILCGGDGIADIIGKKIPSSKIPWSREKSLAGSIAMLLGGIILSVLVLSIFSLSGGQYADWSKHFPVLILISIICAFVESLPIHDFDNLTVPAIAIILGQLLIAT